MDLTLLEEIRDRLNLSHLGKPALIGIVAIFIVVAVVAGRLLISTATAKEFQVVEASTPIQGERQTEAVQNQTIFVHVAGAVATPGVYELQSGDRVASAIMAAGGFTEDAAGESCNLARILEDGEQIVIATRQELEQQQSDASGQIAATGQSSNGIGTTNAGKVNINTATSSELQSLSGIGQATADKIVAYRTANGSFKSIEELMNVSGIGEKKFESIADSICI